MNASNNILFSVHSDTCKPPHFPPLKTPEKKADTFRISQNSSIYDKK